MKENILNIFNNFWMCCLHPSLEYFAYFWYFWVCFSQQCWENFMLSHFSAVILFTSKRNEYPPVFCQVFSRHPHWGGFIWSFYAKDLISLCYMVRYQCLFSGNNLMESSAFKIIYTKTENASSLCFSNRTSILLSCSMKSQFLNTYIYSSSSTIRPTP